MNLNSVSQLPILNKIISSQLNDYNTNSVCIFWIAGGNWLEHVYTKKYQKIYAIDINESFLEMTKKRFWDKLGEILECKKADLTKDFDKLPNAELIIANLLIEYIGYHSFQKAIKKVNPIFVSCVIQVDTSEKSWLSSSPYINAFEKLDEVHHKIDKKNLINKLKDIDYDLLIDEWFDLPNGKKFIRLDFKKN